MGGDLILAVVAAVAIVAAVASIPLVRGRMELGRLRDRYELSDEEVEAYVREFPEICHAVESSLGGETSSREVKRIAHESAISAILRQRGLRRSDPRIEVVVEPDPPEPGERAERELSLHGRGREVTVEDLRHNSNGSRPD